MDRTCYSLFSGCGGADVGMAAAGYKSCGGIEYHQPAADIYNLNHEIPVTVADILDIDRIPTVDLLWVSPPCPSFSLANTRRGETDNDLKLASHIARLATNSQPRSIAIENVRGYQHSQSLKIILKAIESSGYQIVQSIENAANYGTPTTRERLIIRASKGRILPLVQTHQKPSNQLGLFDLPSWISWWDAIADRIGNLPKSQLTDKQIAAIESSINLPIQIDSIGRNNRLNYTIRSADRPSITVVATQSKHPIRILIERAGYYNLPNIYPSDRSAPTIRSAPSIDDKGSYRISHNILDRADCYAADIGCLAAWQGFPADDYQWGDNRGESGRAIGNAVPPPLARAVAKSLVSVTPIALAPTFV
jgi:DNA (cytosine-5)-methyltransferase 1